MRGGFQRRRPNNPAPASQAAARNRDAFGRFIPKSATDPGATPGGGGGRNRDAFGRFVSQSSDQSAASAVAASAAARSAGLSAAAGRGMFSGGVLNLTGSGVLNGIVSYNLYAMAAKAAMWTAQPLVDGATAYLGRAASGVGGTGAASLRSSVLQAAADWAPLGVGRAMKRVYDPYNRAASRSSGLLGMIARGGGEVSDEDIRDTMGTFVRQEQRAEAVDVRVESEMNRRLDSSAVSNEASNAMIAALGRLTDAIAGISGDGRASAARGSR